MTPWYIGVGDWDCPVSEWLECPGSKYEYDVSHIYIYIENMTLRGHIGGKNLSYSIRFEEESVYILIFNPTQPIHHISQQLFSRLVSSWPAILELFLPSILTHIPEIVTPPVSYYSGPWSDEEISERPVDISILSRLSRVSVAVWTSIWSVVRASGPANKRSEGIRCPRQRG